MKSLRLARHEVNGSRSGSTWKVAHTFMQVKHILLRFLDVLLVRRNTRKGEQQIQHLVVLHELFCLLRLGFSL